MRISVIYEFEYRQFIFNSIQSNFYNNYFNITDNPYSSTICRCLPGVIDKNLKDIFISVLKFIFNRLHK